MKAFTVESGRVSTGIAVGAVTLKDVGADVPGLVVGRRGRGNRLVSLPFQLSLEQLAVWRKKGEVLVYYVSPGENEDGKINLLSREGDNSSEKAICFFRGARDYSGGRSMSGYEKFPGDLITKGYVSQAEGSYCQIVAVMPKEVVFRTAYRNELSGVVSEYFYVYDGENILVL